MPKNTVNDPITNQEMAQEAEGPRKLNPSRDQILKRLWELANLSPDVTRGSIAGQIKAMSMIVAIEGLIPSRRHPATPAQSMAQPTEPAFYKSQWLVERENQKNQQPSNLSEAIASKPAATPENTQPPSETSVADPVVADPVMNPGKGNWVPDAIGSYFDADLDTTSSLRLPFSIKTGRFGRHR
jgi:hypothetical protein